MWTIYKLWKTNKHTILKLWTLIKNIIDTQSTHKFPYNILFTFLMDRGRAPNGIGHLMIPSATIVGPANDGYFGIIRYGLNCHWKRYGELGRLIKTYYLRDKFRAKVIIKILKILAESSTSVNRWRQQLGRAHWKVRSGHRASRASTVWHNAILQLVRHPRHLGVTGSVELNNCRDLLEKYASC